MNLLSYPLSRVCKIVPFSRATATGKEKTKKQKLILGGDDVCVGWSPIQFVGSCASRAASSLSTPAAVDAIDHLISAAYNAAVAEITDDFDALLVSPTDGS